MTTVLRKGYGAWSAGTDITSIPEEVPEDLVVTLRPRSYHAPKENRRWRRKSKQREAAIIAGLKSESNR
jgi:hypothetical protein